VVATSRTPVRKTRRRVTPVFYCASRGGTSDASRIRWSPRPPQVRSGPCVVVSPRVVADGLERVLVEAHVHPSAVMSERRAFRRANPTVLFSGRDRGPCSACGAGGRRAGLSMDGCRHNAPHANRTSLGVAAYEAGQTVLTVHCLGSVKGRLLLPSRCAAAPPACRRPWAAPASVRRKKLGGRSPVSAIGPGD
jgi:hypothetical protein